MFKKNQYVKITTDVVGWSDLEAQAPVYGHVEHVYSDGTVQVAYEMCDRHTFTDHVIVDVEHVEASTL